MAEPALKIDPASSVLLLIDFQNEIVSRGGKMAPSDEDAFARFDSAIAGAADALKAAREVGMMVIHVVHTGTDESAAHLDPDARLVKFVMESGALRDKWGCAIHPSLTPLDGETVMAKHGISAFAGTGLDDMLRARNIDTVVICGIVTHWAVEGTARYAFDHGYRAKVLKDASASGAIDSHTAALERIGFIGTVLDGAAFKGAITSTS